MKCRTSKPAGRDFLNKAKSISAMPSLCQENRVKSTYLSSVCVETGILIKIEDFFFDWRWRQWNSMMKWPETTATALETHDKGFESINIKGEGI